MVHAVIRGLTWVLLIALIAIGLLGSALNAIPVSGLVVGPLVVVVLLRHGWGGPALLLGGMTGRLPIAAWMEAHEVAEAARRDVLLVAIPSVAFGLLQITMLPAFELSAVVPTSLPLLVALGLRVCVFSPLSASLLFEHRRWSAGLKEALAPPALQRPRQDVREASTPRRGVA